MSEQARPASRPLDVSAAGKALTFFKVMATLAGIALFILVIVVIIHYGFGNARPSEMWSPIHGIIFFVYVVSVANLGFKVRWSLLRMVRIMLAGVVPILPVVVERKVAAEVEQQLAAAGAPGGRDRRGYAGR
jgi:integral membrane protein